MSKTLLLADDSVVIQKLVGLSFANEDVEIFSTDNGDDAVIKARELRPDVILADVVMPGKSGYEVCEAIKQDPTLAHIPVLLLTGTFEAFDESRASGVGADGHITKPFEAQALVERVKNVIKNARPPAVPARTALPSAPMIPADDLFDDGDTLLAAPPARPGFFGRSESLDVTPSLSEEDLSDSLDVDLFGPPGGEVGGPSFGANVLSSEDSGGYSSRYSSGDSNASSGRFADAPIEDATIAILPEPTVVLPPRVMAMEPIAVDAFADDLGFDDPLQVSELPLASFDLDSAFDPAPLPPPTPPTLLVAHDDANATTARNFGKSSFVTDLDELLASPSTPSMAPRMTPPPIPRPDIRPEAPTILDLGPVARSGADLDFGFDVSEQVAVSKVDLLEESFSSLLDVSESQILGDPAPASWNDSSPAAAGLRSSTVVADFDVSSSDLATAAPIFASAIPEPAQTPAWSTAGVTPAPSPSRRDADLDFFLSEIPAPATQTPASAAASPVSSSAASTSANAAVAHMSPILQQQVQETLEKVAWEAFSDLSETIVKQVIERVERIAWEVIPQMAETLVREEIRKLKGEED